MHYAGKKEFYLHLGGGNFVFSHFPVIFFFLQNIDSHLKKKKGQPLCFFQKFLFMAPVLYKVPLWTEVFKV